MHINKPKNSEVDAYTYIKEELEKSVLIITIIKEAAKLRKIAEILD